MAEFFYRCGPNEYGPVSSAELKKLAQAGRVGAGDQIRQGRTGKWLPATTLPGLVSPPVRREERAINEMDIVAEIPVTTALDPAPAGALSESDTAVSSQADSAEVPALRRVDPRSLPAQRPLAAPDGARVQWATAVVALCYVASAVGLVAGVVILLGERDLLRATFAGVCFLLALVGLAGGCTISLILSLRRSPPRS